MKLSERYSETRNKFDNRQSYIILFSKLVAFSLFTDIINLKYLIKAKDIYSKQLMYLKKVIHFDLPNVDKLTICLLARFQVSVKKKLLR